MRGLTIWQPWADCVVFHGKDVENRSRNIAGRYRGPVAIHAGLRYDDDARVDLRAAIDLRPRDELVHGAIIGIADLVDVHHGSIYTDDACYRAPSIGEPMIIPGPRCSFWGDTDAYHLVLANRRPLAEPIPYRGALGLWTLDDATTARVLEAIA